MKSRVINDSTGAILYESNEVLHLREGELYVKDGVEFTFTGKVVNTTEGETPIKSFYVKPFNENETLKLDE